jgi:uncharacterized protein YaaR (DUF327 family)
LEISRVGTNTKVSTDKKKVEGKKDFSQNFNFERDRRSDEQLKQMLEDIKKKGIRLTVTMCYSDVRAYKNTIKEYLQSVLRHMYNVKKDISFWQTQYFVTVETIDAKLTELTEMLLKEEHENINIASMIDEIAGLVVDIYK